MSILLPISIVIYTLDAVITLTKAVQYLHDLSHDEETKRHLFLTTHNIYQSTTRSCKSLFRKVKEKVLDTGKPPISSPEEKWILLVEVEDNNSSMDYPEDDNNSPLTYTAEDNNSSLTYTAEDNNSPLTYTAEDNNYPVNYPEEINELPLAVET